MNLKLPNLIERPADIPILAAHFIAKYAEMNSVPERPLDTEAMEMLKAHAWPGNIRELENSMHRAVLLADGEEINTDAIMLTGGTMQETGSAISGGADIDVDITSMVGRTVADVERELIIDTLQHCLGNRTHAANILGISIRTLRNKLKIYGDKGFAVPQPGETTPGSN
jgi:DNA-binding NtrC family response regulator